MVEGNDKRINYKSERKNDHDSEGEYCFWESETYLKLNSCRFFKENGFKYLDNGVIFYTLFTWVNKWIKLVSKEYVEPYKFYPLPISDQILYWQPIFSKHVSDLLIELEMEEFEKNQMGKNKKKKKPKKLILFRAAFYTFWKRILIILLGIFISSISNMSLVMIVKKILVLLTNEEHRLFLIFSLAILLSFLQFAIAISLDHLNFYMYRLIHVIQYSFSITIFQHGLCYRRKFANVINGSNSLNVCNEAVHSCSPDSNCSKNPLFCPALRYQNREMSPKIFSFEFMDSYYISLFVESVVNILQFVFTFISGFYFVGLFITIKIWPLYVFYISSSFLMIVIEIINTYILKYVYGLKDYRINKSSEIISGLPLIEKMFMDDIAHNIITETRNRELFLVLIRFVLSFLNRLIVNITTSYCILHILDNFVEDAFKLNDITKFKTSHMMSTMVIILKISDSMLFIPDSIKFLTYSLISYFRAEYFMRTCSPNFYISDNKFTGSTKMSSEVPDVTNEIDKDVVVLYKNASFSWVNNRKDIVNKNNEVYLKNVNFQLKRGEIAIIIGNQGCGKSNFIKSVLGEMTLVSGSMAVVPLHTSMPIFYASQDIWLQQGTIRSNITFGYRFDEEIYKDVLKAVELEFDISSWEKGDMRVVYDNAHSLSGGQRVRMEMARAIYAYLVFSKVNKDYNGQCSFLMCLDSSFDSLDPYVSRTIFNNLFNAKTGLLVKDDLSIILTLSKIHIDIFSLTERSLGNMALYQIKEKTLEKIRNSIDNRPGVTEPTSKFNMNSFEIIKMCESYDNRRLIREQSVKEKYDYSLIINPESKARGSKFKESFKPYIIYFKSTGVLFILFIVFTFVYEFMEAFKYVVSAEMGGDVMEIVENINDYKNYSEALSKIRKLCDETLLTVKKLTVVVAVFSFLANSVLTFTCLRGCKRIHEYCIDSIINRSPSEIKIKKFSSELLTFLSSDIFMIDENFGPCLSSLLILIIEVLLKVLILGYYFPICIPVIVISLFIIMNYIFKHLVQASKNLQISSLESLSRNNSVCENAVSSSSTYRSFKKESNLLDNVIEYTDYCIRSWFYSKSFLSWASFVSKFVFLFMTLSFIIPIIYKQFVKVKSFIGNYGLNLMQNIRIMFSFTNLVITIAKLEMFMCSVKRFECFIPPGQNCVFKKYRNIHEEDLVINYSIKTAIEIKNNLISRRRREFKQNNKKFHTLKKLLFKSQINLVDVTKYLPTEHTGVVLKNVCVYTSSQMNKEGLILNNINTAAQRSDIIGIIGRTGAGKTTLLSVLENTVRHRTGQVLLDGRDLKEIPKSVIRQIIGVLPQLPFVFKGWTIRRFLDPRKLFTDDEINDALDKCGLLEFVNNLHGGRKLDTVIVPDNLANYQSTSKNITSLNHENLKDYYEECDMLLSNSQLRTVSFAKLVLYRNLYRIVLIDEPPSENCNPSYTNTKVSERNNIGLPIYDLIKTYFRNCTTFLTAHEASVLRNCTSVWVMHNGRLIRTCKAEDINANESISKIIEYNVEKYTNV